MARRRGPAAGTPGPKRITQLETAERQAITDAYLAGEPAIEICSRWQIRARLFTNVLRERGVDPERLRQAFLAFRNAADKATGKHQFFVPEDMTEEDKAAAVSAYNGGEPMIRIARRMRRSFEGIKGVLIAGGCELRRGTPAWQTGRKPRGPNRGEKLSVGERNTKHGDAIMAEYTDGEAIRALANKYHTNEAGIRELLIIRGVRLRTRSETQKYIHTHDLAREAADLEATGKKKCSQCGEHKMRDEFRADPTRVTGLTTRCLECLNDKSHRDNLRKLYGLTPEQHRKLLESQGGRCAICGSDDPGGTCSIKSSRSWHVEHDHKLGKGPQSIRGLCCWLCNGMLGHARDNPAILAAAIAYLADPPARKVLAPR